MSTGTTAPVPAAPSPEAQLLATVRAAGIRELAHRTTPAIREMLADMSLGLTKPVALAAPKIFQIVRRVGEREAIKLLVAVLRAFVDSVRVPTKPDAADLMEAAEYIALTYTHDSIKDVMLALKEARIGGMKFFNTLDIATVYGIINTCFQQKADYLENAHLDQKTRGIGEQSAALARLGRLHPAVLESVALMIPASHPNAGHLRDKLSLIKQRLRRGLLNTEQAAQQRRQVQVAIERAPRPDWQPSPEARKLIDARHRAEDRRLAERYRPNPAA